MCAIVDASVADDIFGQTRTPAGVEFFKWLESGPGRMVSGGKLHQELKRRRGFRLWEREARLAGRLTILNPDAVDERTARLETHGTLRSNDHHVIAVAQLSGARLLCARDKPLHADFKTKDLIDNPTGKVFTTRQPDGQPADFTRSRRELLRGYSCSV